MSTLPSRVFKYLTAEAAEASLGSGSALFRSPQTFNDPFDTQWRLDWPVFTNDFAVSYRSARKAMLENDAILEAVAPSMKQHYQEDRAYFLRLPEPDRTRQWDHYIDQQLAMVRSGQSSRFTTHILPDMRVFCVSEKHDNVLMWSHYGLKHQGVVIEFDSAELMRVWHPRIGAVRVEYRLEFPPVASPEAWAESYVLGNGPPTTEDQVVQVLNCKHMGWKYESEWRFVHRLQSNAEPDLLIKYPVAAVRSVWFGCAYPDTFPDRIRAILRDQYPGADIRRLRKCQFAFALEAE